MNIRFNWDALGIVTSMACAIHCAILPLMLTTLPVFGVNIIKNVQFEYAMIVLAAGIGMYSLWHGFRKHHHNLWPLTIFLTGISFLFAKQLWHNYDYWLLPVAVVLIICAHVFNFRACRVHDHAHKEDCDH
ncbi:MAG TPA: MerC domain-containing protein [Flavitalea sp.]|nr:MerC domain-containing protein [Flavitalea sp.]